MPNYLSVDLTTLFPASGTAPGLPGRSHQADLKATRGQITTTANLALAETLRFCLIPSHAIMDSLLISCTAITGGAMDIGLYAASFRNTAGAVVDQDFFCSALSVASALASSDQMRENGVITVANMNQPLWQILGLSADPAVLYEIVGTVTTASSATGSIVVNARYLTTN